MCIYVCVRSHNARVKLYKPRPTAHERVRVLAGGRGLVGDGRGEGGGGGGGRGGRGSLDLLKVNHTIHTRTVAY